MRWWQHSRILIHPFQSSFCVGEFVGKVFAQLSITICCARINGISKLTFPINVRWQQCQTMNVFNLLIPFPCRLTPLRLQNVFFFAQIKRIEFCYGKCQQISMRYDWTNKKIMRFNDEDDPVVCRIHFLHRTKWNCTRLACIPAVIHFRVIQRSTCRASASPLSFFLSLSHILCLVHDSLVWLRIDSRASLRTFGKIACEWMNRVSVCVTIRGVAGVATCTMIIIVIIQHFGKPKIECKSNEAVCCALCAQR